MTYRDGVYHPDIPDRNVSHRPPIFDRDRFTPNTDRAGHDRIMDDRHPLHLEASQWVNQLVLDLKLKELGHENMMSAPITIERLDEWHKKHSHDIGLCRSEGIFR